MCCIKLHWDSFPTLYFQTHTHINAVTCIGNSLIQLGRKVHWIFVYNFMMSLCTRIYFSFFFLFEQRQQWHNNETQYAVHKYDEQIRVKPLYVKIYERIINIIRTCDFEMLKHVMKTSSENM